MIIPYKHSRTLILTMKPKSYLYQFNSLPQKIVQEFLLSFYSKIFPLQMNTSEITPRSLSLELIYL